MADSRGGGLRCWLCSRRVCFVVGGSVVLSSVLYALYRYYCSRRDNDQSKDEGFVDTSKVQLPTILADAIRVRLLSPIGDNNI